MSEGLDPSQPHPVDPSSLLSWPGLGPGGGSVIDHLILPGSELWYRRKNVFFLTTFSHVRFHLPRLGSPGIRVSHLGDMQGEVIQAVGILRTIIDLAQTGEVVGLVVLLILRAGLEARWWWGLSPVPYASPGSMSQAVLRRPLTQVGNSDCSGEALSWAQWGWVFLCWGYCYFTFHSEARGVTPGRCWLVLPSSR